MSAPTDARYGRRLLRCLGFELRKLSARRLPWLAPLAGAAAALLVLGLDPSASNGDPGFRLYARMLGAGLPVAAFFVAILGATAVSGEVASGALRAALLRPMGRSELILAKALVLSLHGALTALVVVAASWVAAGMAEGFGPVLLIFEGLEPIEKLALSDIAALARRLTLVAALPLATAPLLGLLVSTLIDGEGNGVATTALLFGGLEAGGRWVEEARPWIFLRSIDEGASALGDIASGIEERLAWAEGIGPLSAAVLVPGLAGLLFLLLAIVAFRNRTLTC